MQKVLEWANIKLSSVVTDVTGVSAWAMLEALVARASDVTALAELAKGRLRAKRSELEQALTGTLQPHHAFMIAQHLSHLDVLEEHNAALDTAVEAAISAGGRPSDPDAPRSQGGESGRPARAVEEAGSASWRAA